MSSIRTKSSEKSDRNAEVFSRALEALRRGEVVVYPTETFYGLGADALSASAVEAVVALKGRDPQSPVPLIVADRGMLATVVQEIPRIAEILIERFWPGPLTLVLPGLKDLPGPLLNKSGGVGVRISSHPLATRLTRESGRPLTATSANLSGKQPAKTIEEAMSYFSGKIEIFLDGGKLRGKKGSTVVEIRDNELVPIREGEISLSDLKRAVGEDFRPDN
ncbi:MAG: threonylcarbamoyl-AMP synthase [Deltaproteobacteria bacterium]|nr:threonylcarbamoyl-AMP synthase [Deltaproteobacteria bacterium]